MKTNFKTILLATAASTLLLATAPASFAAGSAVQEFGTSVAASMTHLGVKPVDLKTMTYDELLQIETIVQSNANSDDQKQEIESVLSAHKDAMEGNTPSKKLPATAGLRGNIVSGANMLGITIAKPGDLTLSQVEQISVLLDSSDRQDDKTAAVKNVLDEPHEAKLEKMQDTAALRARLVADAKSVGVDIAAPGKLTVDQVDELNIVFNSGGKDSDQKAAVENVLSK